MESFVVMPLSIPAARDLRATLYLKQVVRAARGNGRPRARAGVRVGASAREQGVRG